MRYLGLDLGSKTLGVALSDRTGLIANGYTVLKHEDYLVSLLPPLEEMIKDQNIETIILGYPKNMNNTLGLRAKRTEEFKEILEREFHIPVYLVDERLSTVSAEKTLLLGNTSRKKRKQVIDAVAATIILQTYLDLKKEKKENGK